MFYIIYKHESGTSYLHDTARIVEADNDREAIKIVNELREEQIKISLQPVPFGTPYHPPAYIRKFDKAFFTREEAYAEVKEVFANA